MIKRTSLIIVVSVILLLNNVVTLSQPTLNPESTVNLSTGEMGFNLPLATVKGINGHDFPIAISYKAGIKPYEDASPIGLGFNYGAGSITRVPVYMPDNQVGGDNNYWELLNTTYRTQGFLKFWNSLVRCVSFLVPDPITNPGGFGAGSMIIFGLDQTVKGLVCNFEASNFSKNYGSNTPPYEYTFAWREISSGENYVQYGPDPFFSGGLGKGYFKEGAGYDVPDIYFVQTTYLTGEFVWVGDRTTGHFVVKKGSSSIAKNLEGIKIEYDVAKNLNGGEEKFKIILPDGTRLYFEKSTSYYKTFHSHGYQNIDANQFYEYFNDKNIGTQNSYSNEWYLTKVLFRDFNGSESNPSTSTNNGSWITFGYETISKYVCSQYYNKQISAREAEFSYTNFPNFFACYNAYYLKQILTPNESADFQNVFDRSDIKWEQTPSGYGKPPRLASIEIKAKNDQLKQRITFNTDYLLRQGTLHSSQEDGKGRSLTLKSIKLFDNSNKPYKINFNYNEALNASTELKNREARCSAGAQNGSHFAYCLLQDNDLWGFYYPKASSTSSLSNDFNRNGVFDSYMNKQDIWSLTSIELPLGLKIFWEYEINRFDMANSTPVNSATARPMFGGGIRVKKIRVDQGAGMNSYSINYFYTDMVTPGDFEEPSPENSNTRSSGHATAIPYDYIHSEDVDNRPEKARGGLYTPTKVLYERVIAVKGYNASSTTKAPFGFKVYDFITSKDFPNLGTFGDVDESWRLGYLKKVSNYNSSAIIINSQENVYDYKFQSSFVSHGSNNLNRSMPSAGITRLMKQIEKTNNVKNEINYVYADQFPETSNDKVLTQNSTIAMRRLIFDQTAPTIREQLLSYKTTIFGDDSKDDVIVLDVGQNEYTFDLNLRIIQDIDREGIELKPNTISDNPHIIGFVKNPADNNLLFVTSCRLEEDAEFKLNIYYQIRYISNVAYYSGVIKNIQIVNGMLEYENEETTDPVGSIVWGDQSFVKRLSGRDVVLWDELNDYYDYNGLPNRSIQINSDSKIKITDITPAFCKYSDMEKTTNNSGTVFINNMLMQNCKEVTYNLIGTVFYPVSSSVITWKSWVQDPISGTGQKAQLKWTPQSNYLWKAKMNSDGLPVNQSNILITGEPLYDFSNPSNNLPSIWQLVSTNERVNGYSQITESSKLNSSGGLVSAVSVFGHVNSLSIGTILNATINECGVFTCDYDNNEFISQTQTSYFDKNNGWEHAATSGTFSLSSEFAHFGERSLHIQWSASPANYGPTNNFKLVRGKDYIMTAWVRMVSGEVSMYGDYRYSDIDQNQKPFISLTNSHNISSPAATSSSQTWTLLTLRINASTDITDAQWTTHPYWFARVYVGGTGSVNGYIDDIRFYPVNSNVTTTYYNQLHQLPMTSVDANNNPSPKTMYDGLGRPSEIYKIKHTSPNILMKSYVYK